ncbi:MAG: sensor histidine kinase [Acidimicrobiales bacterium]
MTVAFAVGGLMLSVAMAVATFEVSQRYLLGELQSSATRQAYVNARLVRSGLEASHLDVSAVLTSLQTPTNSFSLIEHDGGWFSSSVAVDQTTLPLSLRHLLAQGRPGRQRFGAPSGTDLAVGVPLPAVHATYFEVFDLADLNRTLSILATTLALAAAGTTVAAGIIGRWASRRVLRPVADIAGAAAEIAAGRLDIRLPGNTDRDLDALTESFNAMVASLAARIERDARFASDVGHELRSPLTTLATSAEVLGRHRRDLHERGRQALDLLTGDLDRFRQLVEDLLEISRSDAGALDDSTEPVAIAELVLHAMEANGAAHVPFHLDGGATTAVVHADKRRIERSVANLLDNAHDHGGGATAIGVTSGDGRVQIVVDDAGPGVPATDRSHIFERFARGAASSHRTPGSGVGLGLAIVSEHTKHYGGRTWVEDAPAGGARFVIELPTATPS